MAQKYLMALDYVDQHANSILQKHAKKRPLGEIETKHRYTPTQPVLSCRTVDIDLSGTRTYRPKSSADIITEQHALIHKIYSKARNIASAPPKRSRTPRTPRNNTPTVEKSKENVNQSPNKENTLKSVEVQGRPLTSLSQRPPDSTNSRASTATSQKKRPKTTGGIKNKKISHENFMIVRANRDLIETRRSYRSLTEKIHKQWKPENHDLNQGTFQRGKKPPGIPTIDSWLTFSGAQGEEHEGLVDAFAGSQSVDDPDHVLATFLEDSEDSSDEREDLSRQGEFYNIEGGVGNRIAQQLQGGDKIRIGINGSVQSQDLRVKKWMKEDSFVSDLAANTNDMRSDSKMAKNGNSAQQQTTAAIIPLCWEDQLESTQAKVLTPRGPPQERATLNLNETRPVVFTKLIPDDQASQNQAYLDKQRKEGFRVKQRKKSKASVDGKPRENQNVTVLTIDSKSEAEEKEIAKLTVDEVVDKSCKSRKAVERAGTRQDDNEKHSVTFNIDDANGEVTQSLGSQSRVSAPESGSGASVEHRHPIIKPTQPTFSTKSKEVNLDIVGTLNVQNGARPLSNESAGFDLKSPPGTSSRGQIRIGSARSTRGSMKSAKSGTKSLGSGSSSSLGFKTNEAEYIQIAHPVKTQSVSPHKRTEYSSQSMRIHSGIREPVPSPELEEVEHPEITEPRSVTPPTPVQPPPLPKQPAPSLSINIPTADYTDMTMDSALDSPTHKQHADQQESSPQRQRAKDMRDEQIDQITDLLGEAIIGQNKTETVAES